MKQHTKTKQLLTLLLTILIMSSCITKKKKADLIVYNAKIYTIDNNFSIAESFAVRDGKILKTGSNEEINKKYESENKLDAKNKIIYPGFIDAHCHFYGYGKGLLRRADLKETGSFDEILEILKKHYQKNPSEWIIGRGWDQNDWEIKEFHQQEKDYGLILEKHSLICRLWFMILLQQILPAPMQLLLTKKIIIRILPLRQ